MDASTRESGGGKVTGRVTGADMYAQQRMSALTTSPNTTHGLIRSATHDADGGNGGLTTGSLSDQPTRVGGYGSMSHGDAQALHAQFLDEHSKLAPEVQAQWEDHARQTNQANGYHDDPAPASASPSRGDASGMSFLERAIGRPADALPSRTPPGTAAAGFPEGYPAAPATATASPVKIGPATNPAPPPGPLAPGITDVVPNGNPNPLKMGMVTGGENVSGGDSGIKVDGKWVTHGADDASGRPTLVAAEPTKAPLSYADQQAEIVKAYPQVGEAGSPQNKQFVDAFTKGGQDQEGALDLAHSLFAPKTQAQAMAADQSANQAAANKQAAADAANRTPAQVQADNTKAAANQAQVTAAGKSVYDPDATATNVGRTVGNVVDALSPQNIGGAIDDNVITPAVSAVKDLWNGFTGGAASTSATPAPGAPSPAAPASNRMPDGSLGTNTPAAPVTPPSPVPPATPPATSLSAVDYFHQQGVPGTAPSVGAPSPSPNATSAATPPPSPNASGAPMTMPKQASNASFTGGPKQPTDPNALPDDDEEEGSAKAYFGKQKPSLFATA